MWQVEIDVTSLSHSQLLKRFFYTSIITSCLKIKIVKKIIKFYVIRLIVLRNYMDKCGLHM